LNPPRRANDTRARGQTKGGRPYDGPVGHTVAAELVAAVLKVEVEVGQVVAADDSVVILESMKMEIPVLAEVAGTVSEIVVSAGDVVNDGDPLVVITPSGR
jgi:acetyl-CoA carboxylase biotin carboxyl carrier protein